MVGNKDNIIQLFIAIKVLKQIIEINQMVLFHNKVDKKFNHLMSIIVKNHKFWLRN